MQTPEDALNHWYGRIDFEKRPALPGELKLDRVRHLLHLLGDPHDRLRIIHVAGTKGKGSTCAMLANVLKAAGYRVGLFTSPHLHDVSERIQVDGQPISRPEILARMREIEIAEREMITGLNPQIPTFFEIGTALGFLHFVCRHVDVAVIEVGLGGRFDSTNVVRPRLSIIAEISYDHMAQLGNTLEKIAFEKAGIIKRNIPVVSSTIAPEARKVIERIAIERHSVLTLIDRDFDHSVNYPLSLIGDHQKTNAAGVLAAVRELRNQGFVISEKAIATGLATTNWPARIEKIGERPLIILDCAHNGASAKALVDTLQKKYPVAGQKHLVVALSSDKQVEEILAILADFFDVFYCTRYANNPRGTPPEQIASIVRGRKPNASIRVYPTSVEALSAARDGCNPDDAIVITGSVFLAGDLRPHLVAQTINQEIIR